MRTRRKGMSLFEITIVMLILGILAAVAGPRFANSLQGSKLVAAANQIAGHIDYVRRVAVNQGRPTTFVCNSSTDTYLSGEVDFPQYPGRLLSVDVKDVHDPSFELVADFDLQSMLTFDFEGVPHVGTTPMQNGKVSISYQGRTLEIHIEAGTGNTTVIDPSQDPVEIYP